MNKMQKEVAVLYTQQQKRTHKVTDLEVATKRIIGIIHLVHQKVQLEMEEATLAMPENISSELNVEQLHKVEEDMR